jgi:hypothetical protein
MSVFDSSVPPIEITDTGPVAPEPQEVLDGVLADMNASMGGNLNIEQLSTPQGQLAQSQAAVTLDKDNVIVELIKNVNPDTSSGVMQDAIGRIYLMERVASQPTVVTCTCGGIPGTLIPLNSKAQGTNNAVYFSTGNANIGAGGTVDIVFQAQINGPTAAPIGSINRIYQQISGWDTVTNAAAGVTGRDVENRADFEFRRKNSVALNATGSLPAVRANVFDLDGVIDVRTEENDTGAPIVIGGVNLIEHSLYVAVVGGVDDDIANAIWIRKGTGCDYNGTTSVIVVDDANYNPPFPQYTVKFQRPDDVRTIFEVNVVNTSQTPANVTDLVQNAILDAWNGVDGSLRARIGEIIYALRYLCPIEEAGPIQVSTIQIARFGDALSESATFDIDEYPTLDQIDITVVLV